MNTAWNKPPSGGASISALKERSAAVGVPVDRDVEHAERRRGQVLSVLAEQDHARARAQHRFAAHEARERLAQTVVLDEPQHGGRFAAGHHQRVEPVEILGQAHRAHLDAQRLEARPGEGVAL
jgi:hypothetical protein